MKNRKGLRGTRAEGQAKTLMSTRCGDGTKFGDDRGRSGKRKKHVIA